MMRRLPIFLAGMAIIAGAWACDSLSDPNKSSGGSSGADAPVTTAPVTTAHVTGALIPQSGAIPTNARVAIVWRTREGLQRGGDAAVIGGTFTIELGNPPSGAMMSPDDTPPIVCTGCDDGAAPTNQVPVIADAGLGTKSLKPRTIVTGGIGGNLTVGYAGFIVYADNNGNEKLDFVAPDRVTEDTVIGGNRELTLVYLRDAGTFELERLSRNGKRPTNGYNLSWAGEATNPARWFPFDAIELFVKQAGLPDDVCAYVDSQPTFVDAGSSPECSADFTPTYHWCVTTAQDANVLCANPALPPETYCAESSAASGGRPPDWGCGGPDGGSWQEPIYDGGPAQDAPYVVPDPDAGPYPDDGGGGTADDDAGPPIDAGTK